MFIYGSSFLAGMLTAMAQTLNEIKQLLAAHGLRPKRRYGQNFLHDGNQMRRIMQTAAIQPGDRVLEVGPGTGALTERLLEAGANLVAVEVDPDLKPVLEQRLAAYGDRVRLMFEDVLAGKHEVNRHVLEAMAGGDFKLIANLPYNVASPLLANLAAACPAMRLAVVMVQKEVADRLAAAPGSKAYGPLGIIIQAMCDVQTVGTLSPGCFWPPPKVSSAVVKIIRRPRPLTEDPAHLSTTLHRLFSQRRKQLKSILGQAIVAQAGLPEHARPETLTVEQLVGLDRLLGGGG